MRETVQGLRCKVKTLKNHSPVKHRTPYTVNRFFVYILSPLPGRSKHYFRDAFPSGDPHEGIHFTSKEREKNK